MRRLPAAGTAPAEQGPPRPSGTALAEQDRRGPVGSPQLGRTGAAWQHHAAGGTAAAGQHHAAGATAVAGRLEGGVVVAWASPGPLWWRPPRAS